MRMRAQWKSQMKRYEFTFNIKFVLVYDLNSSLQTRYHRKQYLTQVVGLANVNGLRPRSLLKSLRPESKVKIIDA